MSHRGWPHLRMTFLCLCVPAILWPGSTGSIAVAQEDAGAVAAPLPAPAVDAASAASARARRHLGKSAIQLAPPAVEGALLSGIDYALRVPTGYAGSGRLQYSVVTGPEGMTIDADAGLLLWTPPISAEGSTIDARVRATDGASTGEVVFAMRVAAPQPVAASLAGSVLTVTQPGSLQGLAVSLPAGTTLPPAQVAVAQVAPADAPPLPAGAIRLSDYFRATPLRSPAGALTITLPPVSLPPGRRADELRLFVYADLAADAGAAGVDEALAWVPTWLGLDVLPGGRVTVKLHGLGDLCFVGVEPAAAPAPMPFHAADRLRAGTFSVSYACSPFVRSDGLPAAGVQVCGITGDVTMNVVVKNFSKAKTTPATSLNELLDWLVAGRASFADLGMSADDSIEVVVETMPESSWLGFVTSKNREDYRVLHLTAASVKKPMLQATAVHEYFHHAQSRTKVVDRVNVLGRAESTWLVEGTAVWFEDEVFDTLDSYRDTITQPLAQVAGAGVAAAPRDGELANWPYARFAFFKMVQDSCTGFSLPQILNSGEGDASGLAGFKSAVESAPWACDFGSGFGGANRSSLAGAMLAYTYATVHRNDVSRLDANEPAFGFEGIRDDQKLTPSDACASFASCPATASKSVWVEPAGAVPLLVSDVPSLSPGQGALVELSCAGETWVWLGDASKQDALADGAWSKVASKWTHVYATGGSAPSLLAVLVNPSASQRRSCTLRAALGGPPVGFEGTRDGVKAWFEGPMFVVGSSGTVTGPIGTTVSEGQPEPWNADNGLRFVISVPNVPGRIVISGSFVASPYRFSERIEYPDGSAYEWKLSKPQAAGDHGCSLSGVDFFIPEEVTWDTSRQCESIWEYTYGEYDKDGIRLKGGSGEGVFGVVTFDIVRQQ